MLPATLKKVKPVGNVAGEGAKIALVNEKEMLEMDELVRKIEFVELAASLIFRIILLMNWDLRQVNDFIRLIELLRSGRFLSDKLRSSYSVQN